MCLRYNYDGCVLDHRSTPNSSNSTPAYLSLPYSRTVVCQRDIETVHQRKFSLRKHAHVINCIFSRL